MRARRIRRNLGEGNEGAKGREGFNKEERVNWVHTA